jgi:isopenicillin-N epimerase
VEVKLTKDSIYEEYVKATEAQPEGSIRLAVIDHISCMPSLIFPIQRLTAYFRSKGITVVVDGAHAVGTLFLDIPSYGADFYFSNFHKWCYAPKSATFMWFDSKYVNQLTPNIISNLYGEGI